MAPPSVKNPRKRTWDHEKDLYDFLLNKIRDPNTQKEKLNDLLHKFYINDPKADSDLIKFTDGLSTIIQSHLLHLQDQNSDDNNTNDDEENLIEYEEERHRFLLNHMKRDGKSYVLEIVEDGVYVKYGDESSSSSCAKKKGKLGVKKSKRGKRLNVQTNRVTSRKGGRGRKMKGAIKLSAAKKRSINNKKSDVASKALRNARKRKRGRPKKNPEKNDVNVNGEEGCSAVKAAFVDESVKKEIQDDDDADDVIEIINVESSDNEVNPRKVTEFREKLMKEINRPYCEEEHKKLSREINARTPVQQYRDLRGSSKAYKGDHDGKSLLDHHLDLLKELEAARDDFPKVLRLLRGFFFWLKYSTQDRAFMPWRDPSCLDELPQQ